MKRNSNKSYIQKTILTIIVCMIGLSFTLTAQTNKPDTVKAYIGPYLGYNMNLHFANFKKVYDTCHSCNPVEFGSSIGGGIAFGGLFEYLLYKDGKRTPMSIGVRLGYSDVSALYSTEEEIGNTITPQGAAVEKAYSKHILDVSIAQINVAPYLAYYFSDAFVGNVGLNVGYIMTGKYDAREELDRPSYSIFKDTESRVRNVYNGVDIQNISPLQIGLLVGIGYEFPIGKYSKIMPELQYNFNFNTVNDSSWRTSSLRFGAAVKFALTKPAFIPPEIFYQRDTSIDYKKGIKEPEIVLVNTRREMKGNDTLVIEKYIKYLPKETSISANLSYYAIMNGQKVSSPEVVIEEFETTEYFPFLTIVYFKDGTSDLGNTKQKIIQKDRIASFNYQGNQDVFSLYYNMLNILAQRMQTFSNTKITITGYSSGVNEDAKNRNIASQRANTVKDYLVNTWGIASNRISVTTGNPPKRNPAATELSYNDVIEESQRVLITTDDLDLIMPIVIKEIEKVATPHEVIFELNADAEEGIKNYNLTLTQQTTKLRDYSDVGNSDRLNTTKIWKVMESPIPLLEANVSAVFNATDNANQTRTSTQNVKVKQVTIRNKKATVSKDIKIERYALCLFEFDKATSTPIHKRVLNDVKQNSIKPDSKLFVSGHADRVGDAQHNMNLATRRMEVVNDAINPTKKLDVTLEAVGNTRLLYDNNTPEGRAFSRTVKIEIHTPTK